MEFSEETIYQTSPEALHARVEELEAEVAALQAELTQSRKEAHIDYLTGALNRRGFELLVSQEWERLQRARYSGETSNFTLLYIDIDEFKAINDTYGHGAGDSVLASLSSRVRERIRESDIFARIGGDEFVIGLIDTDEASAELLRADLHALFLEPVMYLEHEIEIGFAASMGLATYDGEETWSELLAKSDAHMYDEKDDMDLTTSS